MRRLLWLAAVLWVSCTWFICPISSECDPGCQAKVTVSIDIAQGLVQEVVDHYNEKIQVIELSRAINENKKLPTSKLLTQQSKLTKYASNVGKALKLVKAAGAIASFVLTFFMPSDLEVITSLINKRFNEVNAKLDHLDGKLDKMETSLKANVALNTFLSTFMDWEYGLKNGEKKLSDIMKRMGTETRKIRQVKLAEEYIEYFKNNDLEGKAMNIYRMAALPTNRITQRNLFHLIIGEHGCDIPLLSELMIHITSLLTSAARQKLTYYYFKGDNQRATEAFAEIQTYLFEVRRTFDNRVWECKENSVENAKKDADTIVKKGKDSPQENIVQAIFDKLKIKHPWYRWAVAAIKDDKSVNFLSEFQWRGSTHFKVEDRRDPAKIKTFIIVYEDTESRSSCSDDVRDAKKLLIFKRCDGCSRDYIYADDKMMSHKNCSSEKLESLVDIEDRCYEREKDNDCVSSKWCDPFEVRYQNCIDEIKNGIKEWGFIATAGVIEHDICKQSEKCSGHGLCKQIPRTNTHQCICYSRFESDERECDKWVEFDSDIEAMLSDLRRTFNVAHGVPTAVDVFFSVRSLSRNLDTVLKKIKDSMGYTNKIIQHSQVLYNIEDIVDMYVKMQQNQMSFDEFGQGVDAYIKTVTTVFKMKNRLKKMILGKGILDSPGKDIYNSYKKDYFATNGGGCSAVYNDEIKSFRNNLAYLDQALGEALLMHKKWLLETKGKTEYLRAKYRKEAGYIRNAFQSGQKVYTSYWKSYSCGNLTVEGANIACMDELTFEGMTLPVNCDKQRKSIPKQVTCRRNGSELQWDSHPRCEFVWDSWGSWSSCSKTCDGGVRRRDRSCIGTNNTNDCISDIGGKDHETESCNTQKCCSAQYNLFKCSGNNKCISLGWLCDGDNDCGNNDDEDAETCPTYIRAGQMVALKDTYSSTWLGCPGICQLSGCPGSTMDKHDWDSCRENHFWLYLLDHGEGEAVHHGDWIRLKRVGMGGEHVNCWNSKGGGCHLRSGCSGSWNDYEMHCRGALFRIFATDGARQGSCSTDTQPSCRGKPIHQGDNVFLQYAYNGDTPWWLSHYSGIRTQTCPGRYIKKSEDSGCWSESWNIFHNK